MLGESGDVNNQGRPQRAVQAPVQLRAGTGLDRAGKPAGERGRKRYSRNHCGIRMRLEGPADCGGRKSDLGLEIGLGTAAELGHVMRGMLIQTSPQRE